MPSAVDELRELCHGLDEEPLLHASLGSKELFHSNLIAWFVDHHPVAARDVFESWSRPEPGVIAAATERERRHLDLVIHLGGLAPLVVENKVFSPPREDQLIEYAQKVAGQYTPAAEFMLLSLSDPGWPGRERELGGHRWRYRSYGHLGHAMTAAAEHVSGSYDRETVTHYGLMVTMLQRVASLVAVEVAEGTTFAMPAPLKAELEKVRLSQGFEKLRARSIAHYINAQLQDRGLDVAVVDEYTRTWPLLEAFARVPETNDEIGWQYQEGQWRLAVRVLPRHPCHGTGAEQRAKREAYVMEHYADWFDFTAVDKVLGTTAADAPKGENLRRFDPDFLYRYRKAKNATVSQLCDLAEVAARRALAYGEAAE